MAQNLHTVADSLIVRTSPETPLVRRTPPAQQQDAAPEIRPSDAAWMQKIPSLNIENPEQTQKAPRPHADQAQTQQGATTHRELPVPGKRHERPARTSARSAEPQLRLKTSSAAPPPADSSATTPAPPVDRSSAYPFQTYSTANSEHAASGSGQVVCREAQARELFGEESILVTPHFRATPAPASLTDNPVFQSFVLLLAATYAILLYRNLGDVRQLLGRLSRNTSIGSRLAQEPGISGFLRFVNITTTIGILFLGVMIVKYADLLIPTSLLRLLPSGAVLGVSLLAIAACVVVLFYQRFALRIAGTVTRSQQLVSQLLLIKRTYFALTVIITSPVLLLYALCPRDTGQALFYIIAAELFFTLLLYLKESLTLFLSKKISILHWFLYLCTIEIFPVSLLILLAAR